MGSKPAPSYANIFMAKTIDGQFWKISEKYTENGSIPLKFMKRFLDDIFLIFQGSIINLHSFFEEINQIHPYIKFTMTHTTPKSAQVQPAQCSCDQLDSIPFLDTLCEIKNGKIETDLYRKSTDRNQYLLMNSCHPQECKESIPNSLCMRINRICSETESRDQRLQELKIMLMARDYGPGLIDAAIAKARAIPREEALKCASRQDTQNRPVFVVSYDPRLPSISDITRKHWRSMANQDQYLSECFPEPPLIGYKRQRNIRESLIKAKVPEEKQRNQRSLKGMKKCGKCLACSYIQEGKIVKNRNFKWQINRKLDCSSYNIVYIISCQKHNCQKQYIGISDREFRLRIYEHLGYVRNKVRSIATGHHFNLPGHSIDDMKFSIIEQVKTRDELYRREREKFFIRKFNTYHDGINRTV